MTDDQNKFKTNYNTGGRPLTSTFQPPPRPGAQPEPQEQEPEPEQTAIPSGKGGQTPWNSTRSARDWLGDSAAATETQTPKKTLPQIKIPNKLPKLPKLPKMPKLPQMPKFSLPKPKQQEPAPPTKPKPAERPVWTPPEQQNANAFREPQARSAYQEPQARPNYQEPQVRTIYREAPSRKQRTAKTAAGKKPTRTKSVRNARSANASKQPKVISATVSGLICAAIVLLAECGIWGFYCYSNTLPGDTNVKASTFMYCFALFAGNFWAGAVVRRRSLKPSLIICAVFLVLSLVISLNLFSWREIKIKMFLLKIVLTFIAAAFGFILSLVPYLINKAIKKKRQEQQQRRQRQLERRQQLQQQYELERELAQRTRGRF